MYHQKQVTHGAPVNKVGRTTLSHIGLTVGRTTFPYPLHTVGKTSLPYPAQPAYQAQHARLSYLSYQSNSKHTEGSLSMLPGSHVEPVYLTIGEIRKQKVMEEEPVSKAKSSLIYGVITEKQVAKYVTPDPVRIRVDAL